MLCALRGSYYMDKFLSPFLSKADSMPFLFLGSGFSRRYLNIPTWLSLLEYIAYLTYQNKTGFQKAKRQAAKEFNIETEYNSYMTYLCDIISDDLDEVWYDEDRFEVNREKYWNLIEEKGTPPIKIEIATYLESFKNFLPGLDHEIDALKKITPSSIAGIITTNYDTLQENLFDYEVYSSQEELLFHTKYDLGEIYKIHGSMSDPNSILINTKDYDLIEKKHKYIAAKLLTIFVEHPIFFIGYSIGDEDIRQILNDIQACLSQEQLKEIEDRLFYIVWDPEVETYVDSTYTISFDNGRSITIKKIAINDYSLLYKTLGQNKAKYPIKMLRYVKEDMYNIVLTNDPKNRMMLSLPDRELSSEELSEIEFYYGFGMMERAKNGYRLITPNEIFRDTVFNDGNYESTLFVQETLPYALLKASGYLPIRKYTSQIEESLIPPIVKNNIDRFNDISKFLSHKYNLEKKKSPKDMTVKDALRGPRNDRMKNLSLVHYRKENIEELGDYLRNTLDKDNFNTNGELRRLIRIYDFIKYK